MSKKQYSTRLPPDKAEELERHCDQTGVSKSEVLRRSIENHLEEEPPERSTGIKPIWFIVNGLGIAIILFNQLAVPFIATVGSVLFYLGLMAYAFSR
jgi:hypothetical protein